MVPLTSKELEYIVDSISNEDLLIKQCIATAAHSQNVQIQNLCKQFTTKHQQHYQTLLSVLQQHSSIAPNVAQQGTQWAGMQQQHANQGNQSFLQ